MDVKVSAPCISLYCVFIVQQYSRHCYIHITTRCFGAIAPSSGGRKWGTNAICVLLVCVLLVNEVTLK